MDANELQTIMTALEEESALREVNNASLSMKFSE
jgi:hypothetical protein